MTTYVKRTSLIAVLTTAFVGVGVSLFLYTLPRKVYSEELIIRDAIWLDVWSLLFFAVVISIALLASRRSLKAWLLTGVFAFYAFVVIALLLDGTPFSMNGYGGDQQFRQAMILKFMSFFPPGDFYYKDLPPFYPPVYYVLLSLLGRLFSVEAYKLLKLGSMLIYLCGPPLLFILWRQLVSPVRASCITLATYLICSHGSSFPLVVPHAFLADSFFIPWWLNFIERVRDSRPTLRFYILGGLIGALIFSTYFYAFFVGGLLLLGRVPPSLARRKLSHGAHFRWKAALGVLAVALVLSAPYWLPLFLSIGEFGIDRSRGGYHHLGSTGIRFEYLAFSWPGLLFLAGIWFAVRRYYEPLYKGLLLLLGATLALWLVGSSLGAFGISINLVKTRQFVTILGGTFIGVCVADLIRWQAISTRRSYIVPTMALLVLLVFLQSFGSLVKHDMIKRARQTTVPTWGLDSEEMLRRKGSVFLTGIAQLPSFYPVYSFLSINEHYSHPASRYAQRCEFLATLREFQDPYLFNVALRYNKFDAVDYFMPVFRNNQYELYANVSNYPNASTWKTYSYTTAVVRDTALFQKETGNSIFAVRDPAHRPRVEKRFHTLPSLADSVRLYVQTSLLRPFLNAEGKTLLAEQMGSDTPPWRTLGQPTALADFGGSIRLKNVFVVELADSLWLAFQFQVLKDISTDFRIFCHLYPDAEHSQFTNLDFTPNPPTSTWKFWDIPVCWQSLSSDVNKARIHVGFFRGASRLGEGVWCRLDSERRMVEIEP